MYNMSGSQIVLGPGLNPSKELAIGYCVGIALLSYKREKESQGCLLVDVLELENRKC